MSTPSDLARRALALDEEARSLRESRELFTRLAEERQQEAYQAIRELNRAVYGEDGARHSKTYAVVEVDGREYLVADAALYPLVRA